MLIVADGAAVCSGRFGLSLMPPYFWGRPGRYDNGFCRDKLMRWYPF